MAQGGRCVLGVVVLAAWRARVIALQLTWAVQVRGVRGGHAYPGGRGTWGASCCRAGGRWRARDAHGEHARLGRAVCSYVVLCHYASSGEARPSRGGEIS